MGSKHDHSHGEHELSEHGEHGDHDHQLEPKHEHSHETCCTHDHASLAPAAPLPPPPQGGAFATFRVTGMDCSEEIAAIERALKPVTGITAVRANIVSSNVTVYHDGSVKEAALVSAINSSGVRVVVGEHAAGRAGAVSSRAWLVAVSGLGTGAGILWRHFAPALNGPSLSWLPEVAFFIAIIAGGWLVFPKALRSLRQFSLDMNVLMMVAVIGAVAIGEHAEGAAVVFLFSLSELLESWSVGRARSAIQALMQLSPETARVRRGEVTLDVPSAEVALGETVLVKSGERIPLDGEVTLGESTVNQAPITGESMPVDKRAGDAVYAGTINGEGSLELRTTKVASDSTLSKIIKLVAEAQEQKAPAQRFVDVFAKYYTPGVMIAALLITLVPPLTMGLPWLDWLYRGLVLLVIACPCALVISTPVSVVSGLTAMARRGVLIKGGAHLEALGRLRALALDKTGTITEGKPRVVEVQPVGEQSEREIVRIAAAIDTHSTHPLALAVVQYAQETQVTFTAAENYRAQTGRGAEATIAGHAYFLGNHRFAHELGVCSPEIEARLALIEDQARSVVIVGHKPHADCVGEVLGILAVADTIRPGAREAIAKMHAAGLVKIIMLSGDNPKTARAIAKEAGIDDAFGDLLPDDKIVKVKELAAQYGSVGMIGDGVNDAPALAAADIGFAMGLAGTDTAIETADVTLMRDDLGTVSEAVILGRRTLNMIRSNIAFALGVKAIFLLLAVMGHTSLWLAILADTGATLLVILNALRLLKA